MAGFMRRDLLSKKRMVAFLVVDSLQKSILELEEATSQGGDVKLSKYLDSFPFPYYVVLKHVEALPRTLADLFRQWFELMQTQENRLPNFTHDKTPREIYVYIISFSDFWLRSSVQMIHVFGRSSVSHRCSLSPCRIDRLLLLA